jgi:hypothetical protein
MPPPMLGVVDVGKLWDLDGELSEYVGEFVDASVMIRIFTIVQLVPRSGIDCKQLMNSRPFFIQ